MRDHFAIVAIGFIVLGTVQGTAAADEPAAAPVPTTQPAPATRPGGIELSRDSDASVGLSFDRPAQWHVDPEAIKSSSPKRANVIYEMDGFDDRIRSTLEFSREDADGRAEMDMTSPADPSATVSRNLTVHGQPARLTVYKLGRDSAEILTVQTAKGRCFYTITMVFPISHRDKYLALADAVCSSIRITPR